jgi:hypothetical protein
MGGGVWAPGDAAVGYNLRDLDCAPRANGGDEDDNDGGEKNLWVHVASLRLGRCRCRNKTYGWPLDGATAGLARLPNHLPAFALAQSSDP